LPAKKISTTSVERALRQAGRARLLAIFALLVSLSLLAFAMQSGSALNPPHRSQESAQPLRGQTQQQADAKSTGCITCHIHTDEPTMHPTGTAAIRQSASLEEPRKIPPNIIPRKKERTSSHATRTSKTVLRCQNACTPNG